MTDELANTLQEARDLIERNDWASQFARRIADAHQAALETLTGLLMALMETPAAETPQSATPCPHEPIPLTVSLRAATHTMIAQCKNCGNAIKTTWELTRF